VRRLTLIACIVFCASAASAQSLGDVARAEKERRTQGTTPKRVLTNEDLTREQILPAQPETAPLPRMTSTAPASASDVSQPAWNQQDAPGFSLGEHARAMRQQKDAAGTAQAQNPPAEQPALPNLRPAWTAAEQPGSSLGEHARRIRAERARRDAEATLADSGIPQDARATVPKPVASLPAPVAPAPKRDIPQPQPARPAPRTMLSVPSQIVVNRGDSLWKIARKYLGEGRLWIALWTANPELKNPDVIHPGQTLRFPAQDDVAQARSTRYNVRAAKSGTLRNKSVVRKAASQKKLAAQATTHSFQAQPAEVVFTSRVIAGQTVIVPVEKKTRAP
jgi:nucleoid-associated protein YgaU